MPHLPLTTPLPGVTSHALVQVVTTTIWTTDPSPIYTQSASKPAGIPLGPIIGGTAAGFCFACIVVICWVWWGNCIKRKQALQRKEALEEWTVRENTRKNAIMSSTVRRSQSVRYALGLGRSSRKVKFVDTGLPGQSLSSQNSSSTTVVEKDRWGPPAFHMPFRPSPLREGLIDSPSTRTPTPTSSLVACDGGNSILGSTSHDKEAQPLPPLPSPSQESSQPEEMQTLFRLTVTPPTPVPPRATILELHGSDPIMESSLRHKPSINTVSSVGSIYSAPSGESRRRSASGWGVVARLSGWTRSTGSTYSTLEEKQEDDTMVAGPASH